MSAHTLVERALDLAARATDHASTSVVVTNDSDVHVRWAGTNMTTNGLVNNQQVAITTTVSSPQGLKTASLTQNLLDPADLPGLVDKAQAMARQGEVSLEALDLVVGPVSADFENAGELTDSANLAAFANDLADTFEQARSNEQEYYGFAQQTKKTVWAGTSTGTRVRLVQPMATAELTGKSHERSRSAYASFVGRNLNDADAHALAADISQQLQWQARKIEVAPGRRDAVLHPRCVADLMGYMYWSAEARDAAEGRTAFSRPGGGVNLGQHISPLPFELRSDPQHPLVPCFDTLVPSPSDDFSSVFDTGVRLNETSWIHDGVLKALPASRYNAEKAKIDFTPSVDNLELRLPGASGSTMDLVSDLQDGLYLNCLWYIRTVDPATMLLTGLTRDGVYVVKNGEVVGCATNFRFNESPLGVLSRATAASAGEGTMGRDIGFWMSRLVMPALKVESFNFSTSSDAS